METNNTKQEIGLLGQIKEGFSDTLYILKREFASVFSDIGVMIFFFIVPLVYPIIYGLIYNTEVVRNAKIVVVDEDHSPLSRSILRRLDASPEVEIVNQTLNLDEARTLLDNRKAYAILRLPKGMSQTVYQGKSAEMELYCDLSNMLYYKSFMLTCTEISFDLNHEIRQRLHPEMTDREELVKLRPIRNEAVALYNPQAGFATFLLPPILMLLLQQTLLLGICMLAGTSRENNRYHNLVPTANTHFRGTLRVVLGKSLCYISIYAVVAIWVLIVVPWIFSLPQLADPVLLILFLIPYLLACTFFCICISVFIRAREDSMLILVFTSVIFLFLTGVSWPEHALPGFWKAFSLLIPSTPGVQGFVGINTLGAAMSEIKAQYQLLWLQAGAYMILAVVLYRYQIVLGLKKQEKQATEQGKDSEN